MRRSALALAVLTLLAGCAGKGGTTISAPPAPAPADAQRIAVIGDYGVGGEAQRSLGAAVRVQSPDVLVSVGDNSYSSPTSFRSNWDESFAWAKTIVAALGNHDVEIDGGRYLFDILQMPGRYFTRLVGDVRFVVLDSTRVDDEQTRFLRRTLATSPTPWTVVVLHHPPYLCGSERPSLDVRERFLPLLAAHGVPLLLAGHDHDYERFRIGPTMLVVDGGGAAEPYPLRPCKPGTPKLLASNDDENTFLMLTVTKREIRGDLHAVADGRVIDTFRLRAPSA